MRRDLEIDLLRSFVSVAEHENFTRAAALVGRTQSAVSLQIKRLEEITGRRLFDRDRRSVTITPSGEALLVHAHSILAINDMALSQLVQPDAVGLVRVGAPDDYATFLLPAILSDFQKSNPRIQFEVVCDNGVDLLKLQRQRELDLVIATHGTAHLSGEIARYEPLHWVAGKACHLNPADPLSRILFPQGCECRKVALEALKIMGPSWTVAYSTRSIALMEKALLAGSGISVMEQAVIPESLTVIDGTNGLPPLEQVAICLHRGPGKQPPHVTLAADFILSRLQKTPATQRDQRKLAS